MDLQDLKTAYLARHRMSLDDSAVHHVHGFVAFLEAALASVVPVEPAVLADGQTLEQFAASAVETARATWETEQVARVAEAVEAARLAWEEAANTAMGDPPLPGDSSAMPGVAAALGGPPDAPEGTVVGVPAGTPGPGTTDAPADPPTT